MNATEITIRRTGNDVEVIDSDGRTTGALCMGECLEQVIGLIYPDTRKVYPMMTEAEWRARHPSMYPDPSQAQEAAQ